MAINWIAALQAIPWKDVIEASPELVRKAKKLFAIADAVEADLGVGQNAPPYADSAPLQEKVEALRAEISALAAEQSASAGLINSLAEQNARIIEVVEILRVRTRVLTFISVGLAVALVLLALWVVKQAGL